ncbi:RNA polymerase sigma factor RpoD/SigA [Candidatus Riflebacteria bacterium]
MDASPKKPLQDEKECKSLVIHEEVYDDTRARLERKLIKRAKDGDRAALNNLISQNLGYIKKVARKYLKLKLPFEELVNEGVLGFIYAVEKFDLARNVRLITYATFWIKHFILEFISFNSSLISMPMKKSRAARNINKAILELKGRLGRNPKMEEVGEYLNMDIEEIRKLLPVTLPLLSIDKYVGSEEKTPLGDMLEDQKQVEPSEEAMEKVLKENIKEIIRDFEDRERSILKLYFGLEGVEAQSLRSIGKEFGMSQEGVRKIIKKVLKRLRERSF